MRIESIRFRNFKLLRDTTLPLEPLTVVVGPNSSGKSTVLEALRLAAGHDVDAFRAGRSFASSEERDLVGLEITLSDAGHAGALIACVEYSSPGRGWHLTQRFHGELPAGFSGRASDFLASFRAYAPVTDRMRSPSELVPSPSLNADGSNLPVVFDSLRDRDPERWERLNRDLALWLPEFDRVLFDTPVPGRRSIALRARQGGARIGAEHLSSGTLLVLALLAILHAEDRPGLVGIEEPEIGIHPRLLRNVRDALLRMAYPAENGEQREPRQVIVTTHSPYLLDLFRDTPENIIVAERADDNVQFHRLVERADIDDILSATPLGEAWYSGILGGVPSAG
jgi:predicted ATPase